MDILIRKAALRATAKIALSLTVLGCAGEVEREDEAQSRYDDEPSGKGDAYAEPPAYAEPEGGYTEDEEELACGVRDGDPAAIEEIALDEEQLLCCTDLLSPLVPDWEVDGSWEAWQEHQQEAEVQGCCGVAVAHASADFATMEEIGWDTVSACCGAIGNPVGPACTPWGPPVPPAIADLPVWEVA